MLPSPRRWTPERHSRALHKRALWIVDRLKESGKISEENAQLAKSEIEGIMSKAPATPEPAEDREPPSDDEP